MCEVNESRKAYYGPIDKKGLNRTGEIEEYEVSALLVVVGYLGFYIRRLNRVKQIVSPRNYPNDRYEEKKE